MSMVGKYLILHRHIECVSATDDLRIPLDGRPFYVRGGRDDATELVISLRVGISLFGCDVLGCGTQRVCVNDRS